MQAERLMLDAVTQAAQARREAQEAERRATEHLADAIRSAKAHDHPEAAIAEASGLTRQRVWQILKDQ